MKNIFIHVGSVKTGSSYIQRLLFSNKSALAQRGIFYPTMSGMHEERWANGFFLRDAEKLKCLEDEMRSSQWETLVLSEEGLFSDFKNAIPDFFKRYNLKIIAYIRNHRHLISSWTSEFLKPYNLIEECNSGHVNFESIEGVARQLSERYLCEIYGFLDSVDCIGPENIIISQYNRDSFLNPSAMARDFFGKIGVGLDFEKSLDYLSGVFDLVNVSPSRMYCEISLAVFNQLKNSDRLYEYTADLVDSVFTECRPGDLRPLSESINSVLSEFDDRFAELDSGLVTVLCRSPISLCHLGFEREWADATQI